MQNKLTNLQNRVLSKNKESDEYDIWIYLMRNFGWIPWDEYLSLDSEIVDKLCEKLYKLNKPNKKHGKRTN